jgi:flagellar protein FlaH
MSIIDFFSMCKDLCDDGRSILLVAHSYAFDEEMLVRIRSLCDAHFKLRLEQVGDRLVKIMEVLKVRGADRPTGDIVSFEVEPKVGMRIIPLAKAKV